MGYVVIQIISDQSPLCLFLQAERPWASPGSSEEDFLCQTRRDSPYIATIWSEFPSLPSPCAELGWASCPACCLQPGYEEHTEEQIPWYERPTTRGRQSLFLSQYKLKFLLYFCYGNFPGASSHTHKTWARPEVLPWLQWPDRCPAWLPVFIILTIRPGLLISSIPGFPEQCLRHPILKII